jgi:hypothetical protein
MKQLQIVGLVLTIAIGFAPNPAKADATARLSSDMRATIYQKACAMSRANNLTTQDLILETKDLYLNYAEFEPLPRNATASRRSQVKHEREMFAVEQAYLILRETIDDNSCRASR